MSAADRKLPVTPRRMFVASFYSYKGGVGRSVALMNTAYQLALSGRRVVMLDFDLEAPGLHSASNAVWQMGANDGSKRGFVDFFTDFIERQDQVPSIRDYLSPPFGPNRLIQLIPAGNVSDFDAYGKKLFDLNKALFDDRYFGRELLLKMRADLDDMHFDYLLVDSRTGHTDILGATTVLLPQLVVFLTNLSEQSLKGTSSVIRWVQEASDAAVEKKRPKRAEQSPFFLRSIDDPAIQTLVVASPVPFGEFPAMSAAEATLGRRFDHVIYYAPRLAADEAEHVAKKSEDDPVQQYRHFAAKIQALNPFEPITLVEYGIDSLSRQDWRLALSYFDAAERFLGTDHLTESDRLLALRRGYGEVRALALGFQTKKARDLLDDLESAEISSATLLTVERVVANLQMVRGHLASNELSEALKPAKNALRHATALGQDGRPDPWELIARLQLADVHRFRGEMRQAEEAVASVPEAAKLLNRTIERVIGYQLLATAQTFVGKFEVAAATLERAVTEAATVGVGYLTAGGDFVRGLIDLAHGDLNPQNAMALHRAAEIYRKEGDGLSVANCLNELALYYHRLGKGTPKVESALSEALELYQAIAGTSLGQYNVLMYTAEIQTDRGQLTGAQDEKTCGALRALSHARVIATRDRLRDAVADVNAWMNLLLLFVEPDDMKREVKDWCPEPGETAPPPKRSSRLTIAGVSRERHLAVYRLLRQATPECLTRLDWVAQQAEQLRLQYEEAVTRTLVALGYSRLGVLDRLSSELERIGDLGRRGRFSWSIWGQVHNVKTRLHLDNGVDEWRRAASEVLAVAQRRRILTPPKYWKDIRA